MTVRLLFAAVLRFLHSNWIPHLESYGRIRASLTDHWRRSDTTGSGVGLVERQQDREGDEADALVAFYTDRGVGCKYRPKKGGKSSKTSGLRPLTSSRRQV